MLINNQNVSLAIHAIMDAFTALPDNGFRLCIEDKAQEGLKAAGEVEPSHTRRVLSEDELPDFVKKAMGLAASDIESLLGELDKPNFYGVAVPVEAIDPSYDGEKYDHIVLFYDPIIRAALDENHLRKIASEFVRHEWRHGCQFNWLRNHGYNVFDALMNENETKYGEGPLESDAYRFQNGVEVELDTAMASFIA